MQKDRNIKESKKIKRSELARRVDVSYSYIFCIETGRRRCISYKILKKISEVLNIDLHTLFGEEEFQVQKATPSFETIFFDSNLNIDGQELSPKQRINAYNIIKTAIEPGLTKSKKLEQIISFLYDSNPVSANP